MNVSLFTVRTGKLTLVKNRNDQYFISDIPAVVGGVLFAWAGGDGARGGVVDCDVELGRDTVELKPLLKGGGVKLSPDPRAPSLCAGCDSSGCD